MHQPLTPTGGDDLRTAALIGNLQTMARAPRDRRQPQRARLPPLLRPHGRVHSRPARRGARAAGHARVLGHPAARPAPDGSGRRDRQPEADHQHPGIPARRRMARRALGPRGRALDAGAGLPAARARLAASLRRDLRPRGAGTRARLLAVRDGAAEPPGGGLRVRAHAARLRLPLGARAGAHRGGAGHRRAASAPAPAASAGLPQCRRRNGEHRRDREDAGLRHQARRTDAAVVRGAGPATRRSRRAAGAAARHADRRRRERRRDDERVPVEVLRSGARGLRQRRAADERDRVPRASVRVRRPRDRPAGDPALVPGSHLGTHAAGRRRRSIGTRHRRAAARGRPLPHGRRQLDEQPDLGARLRQRAGTHGGRKRPLPRQSHPPASARPTNDAIATPCCTCSRPRRAAIATGDRASGPITVARSAVAPRRSWRTTTD